MRRVEPGVAARLVREQVRMGVGRPAADRRYLCAMDADADEVGERLRRRRAGAVARCLDRLGRAGPKNDGMSMPVFSMIVFAVATCADVTARPRERNPRRRGDLPVLVDHLGREVGLRRGRERRSCRVEERRRPVRERDAGAARPARREVAEAVRDGLAHPVGVHACLRGEDPGRGVRDQDRVVVGEQRAVAADEVQQVRHLLEVRRDVPVVPQEVRVVELDLDDVLDAVGERAAAGRRRGR